MKSQVYITNIDAMSDNYRLTDFINSTTQQNHQGVVLKRSSGLEFLPTNGRTDVPGHNNINVEIVITAVACSTCGERVIVRGDRGEHTGTGSVHTYTYAPSGHCNQCSDYCRARAIFQVDGVSLRLSNLNEDQNCTPALIRDIEQFKHFC